MEQILTEVKMSEYILTKIQTEMDTYEYQCRLRSRRSRCSNHIANIRSTCAGCRAAGWMEILESTENNVKAEAQPAVAEDTRSDVKEENTDDQKPVIRLPNVIKSER